MQSLYDSAFERIRSMWIRSVMFVVQPVFQRILPDPYTENGNVRVDAKSAHVSRVTMTEIISPAHCNIKGYAFAGTILGWIDVAAGIAAKRHAVCPSVTRSVDAVAFLHPIKVGDIVTIQASVNKSWKTSMEVGVKVEVESPLSHDRFFVAHAYLTFVALSPRPSAKTHLGRVLSDFQPIRVPELLPLTPMEIKRFEMAEKRRQARFSAQKPDFQQIRKLMELWSQGLRERSDIDAPIRKYPGLNTKSGYSSPSEDGDEDIDERDPEYVPRRFTRRFSQDPKMLQQMREVLMDTTFAEVVELVMPQHANTLGITFGGQIMAWMETCALTSANRLIKSYLLTASVDSLNFISSSGIGDVVTVHSIVSRTFNSSMEVYVSVEAENLLTGVKKFTNDAFFTVTAVDNENVSVMIPNIMPQTEVGVELFEGGLERRKNRLNQRRELINLVNASRCGGDSGTANP